MFLSAPRATSSRSVWAIAPIEVGVDLDYGTTGIWHVDIDCPAIRNWQSPRGHDATTILEIDRDNSTYLEWCLWEDGGWAVLNEAAAHPIRLTGWRACLRCGSASKPVEACPTCFLVGPCECHD